MVVWASREGRGERSTGAISGAQLLQWVADEETVAPEYLEPLGPSKPRIVWPTT